MQRICDNCGLLDQADDLPCERCGATVTTETEPGACLVRGRGRLRASVTVTGADSATVRIDDDANDEFWAEVHIPRQQLEKLLAEMDALGEHKP